MTKESLRDSIYEESNLEKQEEPQPRAAAESLTHKPLSVLPPNEDLKMSTERQDVGETSPTPILV